MKKGKKFALLTGAVVGASAIAAHVMKKKAEKITYKADLIEPIEKRKMGFYEKYGKRVLDIACATAAIVVFSPLYLGVAALVKLKLGSPVLFTQDRPGLIGRDGKETVFKMYKFRTMTDERDENGELLPDDVRLTKFGKWLRNTSLDELPEAFNILNGTMSVIGPRPQLVRDMTFMTKEQRERHTAKPGLSGLAQVNGRNGISWEEKLDWDRKYIQNVSFAGDVKIIFDTVKKAFIKQEGITQADMATAEDFGDWLLRTGKVSKEEYEEKQEKARELLGGVIDSVKDVKLVQHADIVIINDNNLGFLGGERESQLIIINGASKDYNIAVIQPGEFKDEVENVKFYWRTQKLRMKYLIKNPVAFIAYIFKVSFLIRKINPKVVHSNSQVSFFMVSLMKRFRMISRNIKLVHTDRGLYTKYNSFFRWLFQFSFTYLDTLVTTTKFNADSWKEANDKKNIKLTYKVIGNTAGEIYETIDESKVSHNDYLTVGFAGRMCDWKGWPLAEDICKETYKLVPDVHYKMYVSCFNDSAEDETKEMFSRMENLYGDNFEGRINVPFTEMEQFYYDIDIYVLTSWPKAESFGRTIVEAMSRESAVLTTDAGGSPEVVDDPHTICMKAEEFARHIKLWNDNRVELDKAKKRNLKRVRQEYTLENNVSQYVNLYANMLSK